MLFTMGHCLASSGSCGHINDISAQDTSDGLSQCQHTSMHSFYFLFSNPGLCKLPRFNCFMYLFLFLFFTSVTCVLNKGSGFIRVLYSYCKRYGNNYHLKHMIINVTYTPFTFIEKSPACSKPRNNFHIGDPLYLSTCS